MNPNFCGTNGQVCINNAADVAHMCELGLNIRMAKNFVSAAHEHKEGEIKSKIEITDDKSAGEALGEAVYEVLKRAQKAGIV